MLRGDRNGLFSGQPQTLLKGVYGRLGPAAMGPDGFLWLGTVNKDGGTPVSSDDRVIRIQVGGGGGADNGGGRRRVRPAGVGERRADAGQARR